MECEEMGRFPLKAISFSFSWSCIDNTLRPSDFCDKSLSSLCSLYSRCVRLSSMSSCFFLISICFCFSCSSPSCCSSSVFN
eukprot:22496_4